jgi:hypothetical protein
MAALLDHGDELIYEVDDDLPVDRQVRQVSISAIPI